MFRDAAFGAGDVGIQTENGGRGDGDADAEALARAHAAEVASMREAFEARAAAMQDELLVRPLRSGLPCFGLSLQSSHSWALSQTVAAAACWC